MKLTVVRNALQCNKWILDVRVALVCYEALFHLVLAVDMTAQVSPNSNVYLSETHHHVEES